MAVREIIVDWSLTSGSGHVSVFYFDASVAVLTQRNLLNTFLTQVKAFQSTGTVFTIRTSGKDLDETNGTMVAAWVESTAYNGAGAAGTVPVPDAVQALVQWRTQTIAAGRFLRGRQFLPGIGIGHAVGGNLLATTAVAIGNAGTTLAGSAAKLSVWHRPVKDPITHVITRVGSQALVTGASCWGEFAVLRRRRG